MPFLTQLIFVGYAPSTQVSIKLSCTNYPDVFFKEYDFICEHLTSMTQAPICPDSSKY